MTDRYTALVLAGSRGAADPVAASAGVSTKALAPLAGRPMIAHVLDALSGCQRIDRIAVSIEPAMSNLPATARPALRLDAAASPAASVLDAASRLGTPLLVTTADNPLMTAAMVGDFLDASRSAGADITAGICPRAVVERAGNPGRRTYLRFRDGDFSGCNLFVIATRDGLAAVRFWQTLETERKRPWRMARQIGIGTLLLYATRQLSVRGAAAAVAARTGCRTSLVEIAHPLAAHDVDTPEDLAFAERMLAP